MRALVADWTSRKLGLREIPEPRLDDPSHALIRIHEIAVSAEDRAVAAFALGHPPAGSDWLVAGQWAVGQVLQPGVSGGELNTGDWVVPVPRMACAGKCPRCAAGNHDLCWSALPAHAGVSAKHGFACARAAVPEPSLVRVPFSLIPAAPLIHLSARLVKAFETARRLHADVPVRVSIRLDGLSSYLALQFARVSGWDAADAGPHDVVLTDGATGEDLAPDGVVVSLGRLTADLRAGQSAALVSPAAPRHYRLAIELLQKLDQAEAAARLIRLPLSDYARGFLDPASPAVQIVHTMN